MEYSESNGFKKRALQPQAPLATLIDGSISSTTKPRDASNDHEETFGSIRGAIVAKLQQLELDNDRLRSEKDFLHRQILRLRRRLPTPPPATTLSPYWSPKLFTAPPYSPKFALVGDDGSGDSTGTLVSSSRDHRRIRHAQRESFIDACIEDMRLSMAESNGVSCGDYSSLSDSYEDYALRAELLDTISIQSVESEVPVYHSTSEPNLHHLPESYDVNPVVIPPQVKIARKCFEPGGGRLSFPTSSIDDERGSQPGSSAMFSQTPVEMSSSIEAALYSSDIAVRTHRHRQHSFNSSDRRKGFAFIQSSVSGKEFDAAASSPHSPYPSEHPTSTSFLRSADIERIRLEELSDHDFNFFFSYSTHQEKAFQSLALAIKSNGERSVNTLPFRLSSLAHAYSVYTCIKGKARLIQSQMMVENLIETYEQEESSSEYDLSKKLSKEPIEPKDIPCDKHYSRGDIVSQSSTSMEYYSPPDDASLSSATQSVPETSSNVRASTNISLLDKRVFKSGTLSKLSGKFKLWHHYWCVLTNRGLFFYTSRPKDTESNPVRFIPLSEVQSIHHASTQSGAQHHNLHLSFEVKTLDKMVILGTNSAQNTNAWIGAIRKALKRHQAESIVQKNASQLLHRGWLKRVKYGHSQKVWCLLLGNYLVYYRNQADLAPTGYRDLRASLLKCGDDVSQSTSDSDSDTTDVPIRTKTLAVWQELRDPVYFVCQNDSDYGRWKHYLGLACAGTRSKGLVLLAHSVNDFYQSQMFHSKDTLSEPVSNTTDPTLMPLCISIQNCLLHLSYPTGSSSKEIQLAKVKFIQDMCKVCFTNPGLKDELFLQLLKQSRPSLKEIRARRNMMSFLCSTASRHISSVANLHELTIISDNFQYLAMWECLCLVVPLFLPSPQVLGGLEAYLFECAKDLATTETGKYAAFCLEMLKRTKEKGGRQDVPSFVEVTAISMCNPYKHDQPFSLPVHVMNGNYHVVSFDSTTLISELCSAVVNSIFRSVTTEDAVSKEAFLANIAFSLYCKDVDCGRFIYLDECWKVCDIISRNERNIIEKDPCACLEEFPIKIYIRVRCFTVEFLRSVWLENENNQSVNLCELLKLIVYQLHNDVRLGFYFLSASDLLVQIALLCQAEYQNYSEMKEKDRINFDSTFTQLFPASLIETSSEEQVFISDKKDQMKELLIEKWSSLPHRASACETLLEYIERLDRICSKQFCSRPFFSRCVSVKNSSNYVSSSSGSIETGSWMILIINSHHINFIRFSKFNIAKCLLLKDIVSFGGQGRSLFLVAVSDTPDRCYFKLHFVLPDACSVLEILSMIAFYINLN